MKYWVSGGLVPAQEAAVSVLDHGLTVGDGVFETCRLVNQPDIGIVPFALDRHLDRLARSAAGMGMDTVDSGVVRDATLAVCEANPQLAGGGRLRITLTSGPGPLGSDRGGGPASLAVVAAPATAWPESTSLAVSPWPRNNRSPLAGIKSTSYGENVLALARAKRNGAGEALLANLSGEVCEGTGSNVFLFFDGVLTTPPLDSGCLAGITRALVLQWSHDAGLAVAERPVPLAELPQAQEIFITSSTRDVHRVSTVVGDGGERVWTARDERGTAAVSEIFARRATENWNP